jgi:hypothetical protein
MIDDKLLSHCLNIAHTVAPELRSRPLYIVDGTGLTDLPVGHGDVLGWAWRGNVTNYRLRDYIGSDWEGPGPVISLLPDPIRTEWGKHFRDGVLSTLLHELAHLLPPAPAISDSDFAEFDVHTVREWQQMKWTEANALPEPPPGTADDPHGPEFVRIVTHLWARSTLAGWSIPGVNLYGGGCWFLSQPAHFVTALLREIVTMREAHFAEIIAADPPSDFTALWQGGLDLFHNRLRRTER